MRRSAWPVLVSLLFLACQDDDPTSPAASAPTDAAASIFDGAHGGNDAFFFLPPIVPDPNADGVFNPHLTPVVEICEVDATVETCAEPQPEGFPLRFTMDGGGSEAVRLVEDDEHYIVNWHTGRHALDASKRYRIRVFPVAGGAELGHADVAFDGTSGVDLFTLWLGSTLPIASASSRAFSATRRATASRS